MGLSLMNMLGLVEWTPLVYVPPFLLQTKFRTHTEKHAKIVVLYVHIFTFLDSKREDKVFWTEW
jgi:hypothetical protein